MELNEWSLIFVTPVQALSAIAIAVQRWPRKIGQRYKWILSLI